MPGMRIRRSATAVSPCGERSLLRNLPLLRSPVMRLTTATTSQTMRGVTNGSRGACHGAVRASLLLPDGILPSQLRRLDPIAKWTPDVCVRMAEGTCPGRCESTEGAELRLCLTGETVPTASSASPKRAGTIVGRRRVQEWDPATGRKRDWIESAQLSALHVRRGRELHRELVVTPPTGPDVLSWMHRLASSEVTREEASSFAKPWVTEHDDDVDDLAVFDALELLWMCDAQEAPDTYLNGPESFSKWAADLELILASRTSYYPKPEAP